MVSFLNDEHNSFSPEQRARPFANFDTIVTAGRTTCFGFNGVETQLLAETAGSMDAPEVAQPGEPQEPPVGAAGAQANARQRTNYAAAVTCEPFEMQIVRRGHVVSLIRRQHAPLRSLAETHDVGIHPLPLRDAQPRVRTGRAVAHEKSPARRYELRFASGRAAHFETRRTVVRRIGDPRIDEQLVSRDAGALDARPGEQFAERPRPMSRASTLRVVGIIDANQKACHQKRLPNVTVTARPSRGSP